MRNIIYTKHPGVTSLLFVLVIGLVLVVMVAGIASLTIREQQQASNVELSNRALQTAESGIKAAVQKLVADPNYTKLNCDPTDYSSLNSNNQSITCLTVSTVFQNYESFVQKDRVERLFMGKSFSEAPDSPAFLSVKWNNPSLGDVASNFAYTGNLYPTKDYPNAATIELTIVYWPVSSVNANGINTKKFLLAPANNNPIDSNLGVTSACPGTSDYKCETVVATGKNGFDVKRAIGLASTDSVSNYNFGIIIGSRYKGTHIQATAYDSANKLISVKSANAQIDSTAKAGNLYRRLKASRATGLSGAIENVLDGPIFSGRGSDPANPTNRNICKNFQAKETSPGIFEIADLNSTPNCNNIPL